MSSRPSNTLPVQLWRLAPVGIFLFAAGCAATNPATPSPDETLVVLNTTDGTLSVLPITRTGPPFSIVLSTDSGAATAVAMLGATAVVSVAEPREVLVVNLTGRFVRRRVTLEHVPGGVSMVSDSVAYVAGPAANVVTRINLQTGDTASVPAGQTPVAFAVARGRVFVLNANLEPVCDTTVPCIIGPSWLTVIDPEGNIVSDSIGMPGPGNANAIVVGGDGLLYALSSGGADEPGRIVIVDPVSRAEVGSFGGFGLLPRAIASDGRERLYVVSPTEGLMEFNTRTRRVVRGAGSGIPLQDPRSVVVDGSGLVYVIESGGCAYPIPGRIRVFRPELTEARVLPAGICADASGLVKLPPILPE
jgi:hypothetical protein